ncbi:hypothetical protein [Priestia taiwanensis]|uniref:Uncharacterized protein n=1 Tax=Priestia taiwanensis TaxID=1347902 RepID=A0A917AWB6_9BACI|nr:hypothetical protein [Priestia taiwanensis]MBM7364874.1 hypothetical protein [Priestia taiwanensis]GGE82994.1 hypothetical protein GCM10007140_35690 [Priestia taiwanensis]
MKKRKTFKSLKNFKNYKQPNEDLSQEENAEIGNDYSINISIYNINNIATGGGSAGNIEKRAEGGGQINENVGINANQGGHNAINGSESFNFKSQFANGNGRSGIAGKGNDEQGGQEAIKIRKQIKDSDIQFEDKQEEQ